jgi:hypothetical protein
MTNLVRGKVARILNSRDLVINRGSEAGVVIGMRFAVLDPAGEGVSDPDTGEVLGSLQRPKVQVEVTQVSSRIAVARTYRHRKVNVGGAFGGAGDIARMFAPPRIVERYETFKVDDADWEPLTEEESIVKVGDPVVQIEASEEEEVGGIIIENLADELPTSKVELVIEAVPVDEEPIEQATQESDSASEKGPSG